MKNFKKEIAVIILNWNGRKLLEEFLPSIAANIPEAIADLIVADNGSDDDSLSWLAENFPQVKVIRFTENHGYARGYNLAVEQVSEDYRYTILLNSDVAADSDWITPLHEFMKLHPESVAVQPKILSYRDHDRFEYAGAAGGFIDCNGYPYCRGRIFDSVEKDTGQYDTPMEIFWASGAALMVRNDAYLAAGGLDEDFFAHMEEIDLCWRIKLKGGSVWCEPRARVYHLGGGSLPAENPRKTYLNFRNNLLMLHKNLPDSVRSGKLFVRRLLDTLAFFKFVAGLDFANAKAIWKAHRDFAAMRKRYTSHPDRNLLPRRPNILVEYYLKGRRRFSSLGQ